MDPDIQRTAGRLLRQMEANSENTGRLLRHYGLPDVTEAELDAEIARRDGASHPTEP